MLDAFGDEADMHGRVAALVSTLLTQSGHEQVAFAAMQGPYLLYFVCDPWPLGRPYEAARRHHTSR